MISWIRASNLKSTIIWADAISAATPSARSHATCIEHYSSIAPIARNMAPIGARQKPRDPGAHS
ncbi:MAG TPA: hypothetical protein VMG30_03855 [Acidobacteriota bacterium]|nr:hypothetical protein [Acidobacteriota bacterium]